MSLEFDLAITNPKEFIQTLKGLKGRAVIRTQHFLELAQAQLSFVAQTDETFATCA
jgi:hypothetical protein